MNINELRIGNLVRCKEPNSELYSYMIKGINENSVDIVYFPNKEYTNGIQYQTKNISMPIDFIFPILLTEEVLFQCCFERFQHYKYADYIANQDTLNEFGLKYINNDFWGFRQRP